MPIEILDAPDPLSEASLNEISGDGFGTEPREPILIESDADRLLGRELLRYCRGEITGRSFLIAGHRGAGKTTVVANVFQRALVESRHRPAMLRPVFVSLHGPSLFPPEGAEAPPPAAASTDGEDGKNEAPKPPRPAQLALEQIVLGLHRAVAREFTMRFPASSRSAAERSPFSTGSLLSPSPHEGRRDLSELRAQFECELYECPAPARLRQFWSVAGVLSEGVLFEPGRQPSREPGSQGFRELVALSGVIDAYRRISGKYTRNDKSVDTAKDETKTVTETGTKELVQYFASLLTGGAAGASVFASSSNALTGVVGGVLGALGAAAVSKVTATRSRDRSVTRDESFVFDLSVATLDRVLPLLIERLRRAGLAPVFVVDELDKVEDLEKRILVMVHHLKKLVAENAFFCFLTDRQYFESLSLNASGYDVQHSYYSQRLLISFRAADFSAYLRRLLVLSAVSEPAGSPAGGGAIAAAGAKVADAERADLSLLPWVLKHRSKLHALDMKRELAKLKDGRDSALQRPGAVRSEARYRIDVTFQAAFELMLEHPTVQVWLADKPDQLQWLHDALYYVSRRWAEGDDELNLSTDSLETFRTYLASRSRSKLASRDGDGDGKKEREELKCTPLPSEDDIDVLFSKVRRMADFLANTPGKNDDERQAWTDTYRREWAPVLARVQATPDERSGDLRRQLLNGWMAGTRDPAPPPLDQVAADALLLHREGADDATSLLIAVPGETERYAFRYFPTGESRQVGALAAPATSVDDARSDIEYITRFAAVLAAATGDPPSPSTKSAPYDAVDFTTLAEKHRIIATSPAWSIVAAAMERLRVLGATDDTASQDREVVHQFRELLTRSSGLVARTLISAAVIGASGASAREQLGRGLECLSVGLRTADRTEQEVEAAVRRLLAQIDARASGFGASLGFDGTLEDVSALDAYQVNLLVALGAGQALEFDMRELSRAAWERTRHRIGQYLLRGERMDVEFEELRCSADDKDPIRRMLFDPSRMTVGDWSHCFTVPLLSERRPLWLSIAALHALGHRRDERPGVAEFFVAMPEYVATPEAAQTYELVSAGIWPVGRPTDLLVVVQVGERGFAAGWAVQPDAPVLVVRVDQLKLLESVLLRVVGPYVKAVVVEMSMETAFDEGAVLLSRSLLGQDRPVLFAYYPHVPKEGALTPAISAPRNASDLVSELRRLQSAPQDRS